MIRFRIYLNGRILRICFGVSRMKKAVMFSHDRYNHI